MLVQFLLSSLVLYLIPNLRPKHQPADYTPIAQPGSGDAAEASRKPLMTAWFYLTRIGPCGAATGLDIGLGNMSLKFISLTFYTMCKSSVLGFVLIFAFLFRLEQPSLKLGAIIVTMIAGVLMMVAGETAFSAFGFILVMSAAFFSGFRWSLTQILLLRSPATNNPFSSIFFLAPVMFMALLVIALPVEGPIELVGGLRELAESRGVAGSVCIILFPGILAFLMTASEFALLKRTSAVTLSVCGIFKEVLTISAAGLIFGDKLTTINISGLVVTIASIAAYNVMKMQNMRVDMKKEAHQQMVVEEIRRSTEIYSAEGSKEHGRRASTAGALIRNSLNMAPLLEQNTKDRASPVKRPGDLD
jgi:solute carrier family 35 protein C2